MFCDSPCFKRKLAESTYVIDCSAHRYTPQADQGVTAMGGGDYVLLYMPSLAVIHFNRALLADML